MIRGQGRCRGGSNVLHSRSTARRRIDERGDSSARLEFSIRSTSIDARGDARTDGRGGDQIELAVTGARTN